MKILFTSYLLIFTLKLLFRKRKTFVISKYVYYFYTQNSLFSLYSQKCSTTPHINVYPVIIWNTQLHENNNISFFDYLFVIFISPVTSIGLSILLISTAFIFRVKHCCWLRFIFLYENTLIFENTPNISKSYKTTQRCVMVTLALYFVANTANKFVKLTSLETGKLL